MKQAYTQFHGLGKRIAVSLGITLREVIERYISSPETKPKGGSEYMTIAMLEMERAAEVEKAHLFLPGRGFCDWLVGCVNGFDKKYLQHIVETIGGSVTVIHFPCSSHIKSCMFIIPEKAIHCDTGELFPPFEKLICEESLEKDNLDLPPGFMIDCHVTDDSLSELHEHHEWLANLIFGLGMYISAFPETLKDGPPEDLKHPANHQYPEAKTIGISEKISLGGTHASPMAHFRKGHFRLLSSPVFTKKRFQAVFVHETFVNAAHAKTVLAPEEVSAK